MHGYVFETLPRGRCYHGWHMVQFTNITAKTSAPDEDENGKENSNYRDVFEQQFPGDAEKAEES